MHQKDASQWGSNVGMMPHVTTTIYICNTKLLVVCITNTATYLPWSPSLPVLEAMEWINWPPNHIKAAEDVASVVHTICTLQLTDAPNQPQHSRRASASARNES